MSYDETFEDLVALYLRLNGYFTSGLILHSAIKGQNKAEVDLLAVRHPFHNQDNRAVPSSSFLGLKEGLIDLLICEVKSSNTGFNKSIRNQDNLADALSWCGLFPVADTAAIAEDAKFLFEDDVSKSKAEAGLTIGGVRIRGLICYPRLTAESVQRWCLTQEEIMDFCLRCLSPRFTPPTCTRKYDYEIWGTAFESIVQFFKSWKATNLPTSADLLKSLE